MSMSTTTSTRTKRVVPSLLALGLMGAVADAADPVISAVGGSVGTGATVQVAFEWTDDIFGWDPLFASTTAAGTGGDLRLFETATSTTPNPSSATALSLALANIVSSNSHKTVLTYTLTGANKYLWVQVPAGVAYGTGATPTAYPAAAMPGATTATMVYTMVPATPASNAPTISVPTTNTQTTQRQPTIVVSANIDDDEGGTPAAVNALFSTTDNFKVGIYEGGTLLGSTVFHKTGWSSGATTGNRQTVAVNLTTALAVGSHTLTAKVLDPLGAAAATQPTVTLLVWDAPTIQVNGVDVAAGATAVVDRTSAITISGTAFKVGSVTGTITMTVDDVSQTVTNPSSDPTKFTATVSSLEAGATHSVIITQTPSAPFASSLLLTSFTIDNQTSNLDVTAPDVPVIATPGDASTLSTRKPAITGTTEPLATVTAKFYDQAAPGTAGIMSVTADANGAYSFGNSDWAGASGGLTALVASATNVIQVKATDKAGNASAYSSDSFTVVIPSAAVNVAFTPQSGVTTAGGVNYTNAATVTFDVGLTGLTGSQITSGALNGWVVGDFTVTGGTITGSTALTGSASATAPTITVTPTGANGTVTLAIAADKFDIAGTNNQASSTYTLVKDTTAPTAAIGVVSNGTSTASVGTGFKVTITSAEALASVDATKIVIAAVGTAGSYAAPSGASYTLSTDKKVATVSYSTPATQGTATGISITLLAAAATDLAGNTSAAVTTAVTRTFDTTAPTLTGITSTVAAAAKISPIPFTFTFGETITGFDIADIDVTNGVVATTGLTGSGASYALSVIPGEGPTPVKVAIKTGTVVTDAVGNSFTISYGGSGTAGTHYLTRTYDSTAPRVLSLSSSTAAPTATDSKPTNRTSIPCSLVFSESVTGLSAASFQVEGGAISGLTGAGSAYTFNVDVSAPTTADKKVRVVLMAGKVQDAVANTNSSVAVLLRNYDGTVPTLDLDPATPPALTGTGSTSAARSNGTFTFKINNGGTSDVLLTKFDKTKIIAIGGTIDSITTTDDSGSPAKITGVTVNVTLPRAAGNVVTLQALPGALTDAAGNKNASSSASLTVPGAG